MEHLLDLISTFNSSLPIYLDLKHSYVLTQSSIKRIVVSQSQNDKRICTSQSFQPSAECLQHSKIMTPSTSATFNYLNWTTPQPLHEFSSV